MNNYRIDSPHRQLGSPHDRETKRQRADLEQRIRQAIAPFLPKDQEGQRIANLCVQQLSDSWSDEVRHGLDATVAQQTVLGAIEDEMFPILRVSHGTSMTHALIGAMNRIADQLVAVREMTTLDSAWNTPDRKMLHQRQRDDDVQAQLRAERSDMRHQIANNLTRRGKKGGFGSRPPIQKF